MSDMLEQAVIDATALKEAAIKNAEKSIVDKYSPDIREAVERILEADEEPALPGAPEEETQIDTSAVADQTPGAHTGPLCAEDDEVLEINFDQLQELIAKEEKNNEKPEANEMISREQLAEEEININESMLQEILAEEAVELDEDSLKEMLDAGVENLEEVDNPVIDAMKGPGPSSATATDNFKFPDALSHPDLSSGHKDAIPLGQKGTPMNMATLSKSEQGTLKPGSVVTAKRGSETSVINQQLADQKPPVNEEEDIFETKEYKDLYESQQQSEQKYNKLHEEYEQIRSIALKMKEKLNEASMANTKYFYTNRILSSTSLNERQKKKIVEAITIAETAKEVKTIFETLQSTVESVPDKRTPQSLGEVINRRSSAFLPQREEKTMVNESFQRMRKLAGIDNR